MRSEARSAAWHRQSLQRWTWKSKRPAKADAAKKMETNHERLGPPRLGDTGLVEVRCYDRLNFVRGRAHDRIVDLFSGAGEHGELGRVGEKHRGASIRKSERRTGERLLRGRNSGRNSDAIGENFRSKSDLADVESVVQKHSTKRA